MANEGKITDRLGEHLTEDGQFQSDKYPWCEPDFVPLKVTDPEAAELLAQYAIRRAHKDPIFAADLLTRLGDPRIIR